jgi:plastocyanin
MRRSTLIVIIIVAVLAVAGAVVAINHNNPTYNAPATSSTSQNTANNTSTGSNSNSQPSSGTINIKNMMFTPPQITVAKGGSVTWTNNDTTTHTVVDDLSNVGGPASGDIAPGGTYSFTFSKTGSFQYHCSIHPSMRGTIVVK